MAREDDDQNPRATRSMRRDQPATDRLGQDDAAGDPLNPGWRSTRSATRRRAGSVPFSRQELALWLQYGGWRFILAAIAILAVAGTLYVLSQPAPAPLPLSEEQPEPDLVATLPALATSTPAAATPAPSAAPQASGQQLRVTGTEGLGLFLRPEPNTNNQPLKTLADDTLVTVLEGPTTIDGREWVRVRDDSGAEGWVASEFLTP